MFHRAYVIALLLVLQFVPTLAGQPLRAQPCPTAPAATTAAASTAMPIPTGPLKLHTHTLKNGLEVVVVENPAVPIVTIEIAARNGSMNEPLALNGLSHLYEHMFFKANSAIPNQQAYARRLRQLGAVWNGTTSTERVNYFFTLGSQHLEAGVKFMADAIRTPVFDSVEFKKERQVVLGEFDRAVNQLGFRGAMISSNICGKQLDEITK